MRDMLRRIIKEDRGNSSVTVLVVILIISSLFLAVSLIAKTSLLRTENLTTQINGERERDLLVEQTIDALEEDTTPESHSQEDPVWDFINADHSPYTLKLKDISSRLNINWMRTKLFEETDLSRLIISGEHPDSIQARRREEGFTTNLAVWTETFGEENLTRFFTLHSLANVNVTYEESLVEIYTIRHGEGGAQIFHDKIQQGLKEFKLWDREELPPLLGMGEKDVIPVITAMPQMNVHYIDPFLLKCLLSYPYKEDPINNSLLKAQNILDARASREITPGELKSIIAPTEKQLRVLEYLGTQTSFWKLTVSRGEKNWEYAIFFDGENWGRLE